MAHPFRLSEQEFQSAVEVLEREHRLFVFSPKERCLYRALNLAAIMAVVLAICIPLLEIEANDPRFKSYLALCAGTIVIFALNAPFILKLWKLDALRRTLGISKDMRRFIGRRPIRIWGVLQYTIFVVLLAALGFVAYQIGTMITSRPDSRFLTIRLVYFGTLLLAATSLISTFLMRSCRKRLDFVRGLLTCVSMGKQPMSVAHAVEVDIPSDCYHKIAEIERDQIIRDRYRSIALDSTKRRSSDYAIQFSSSALRSLILLEPSSRLLVDKSLLKLSDDPARADSAFHSDSGFRRVHLSGTAIVMTYIIDEDKRRIRVHELQPISVAEEGSA